MMTDPDKMTPQEKITEGLKTIEMFFDSLGPNDIYKQILLEELMRMLLEKDAIYLPGET